jgi:hypothetical protein
VCISLHGEVCEAEATRGSQQSITIDLALCNHVPITIPKELFVLPRRIATIGVVITPINDFGEIAHR